MLNASIAIYKKRRKRERNICKEYYIMVLIFITIFYATLIPKILKILISGYVTKHVMAQI
jgi:hypothetical protein